MHHYQKKAAFLTVALSISTFLTLQSFSAFAAEALPQEVRVTEPFATLALAGELNKADEKTATPDEMVVDFNQAKTLIGVRKVWETGHAALYINNKEVIRFRSQLGNETPYDRAKRVAEALQAFLKANGSPRDIKPGLDNGKTVIRAGESLLAMVDAQTALEAKQDEKVLALMWSNQLRQALGADAIERDPRKLASRGMIERPELFSVGNYRPTGVSRSGMASWYGPGFHGRRCANGSRFNMNALTAAHRTLPFGTLVKVFNQRTKKTCVVKITDRGPFHGNRIIDLSRGAAQAIGLLGSGVARVTLEVLAPKAQ